MSFEMKKAKHLLINWWTFSVGRLRFDLSPRNLYNNAPNPFDDKLRGARQDLSHAYVDVFVEFIRATAYLQGHIYAILLLVIPVMVVWQ